MDVQQFLWQTFIIVVVPSAFVLVILAVASQRQRDPSRRGIFAGSWLAFLSGAIIPLAWLSWNSVHSIGDTLRQGPPKEFPQWQIVCCGISIVILGGVVHWIFSMNFLRLISNSVLFSAGFATMFSAGDSFENNPQAGIGIVLSLIGIGISALVIGIIVSAIKRFTIK